MKILCVHQSAELYGSDRSFVTSIGAFKKAYPSAQIDVLLPCGGPLTELIRPLVDNIKFSPLFVLRRRRMMRLLPTLPFLFLSAWRRALRATSEYDIVYINTAVVLDHIVAARWHACVIVHVREMPSPIVARILGGFLRFSRARIIYNSKATQERFGLSNYRAQTIVYNGVDDPAKAAHPVASPPPQLKILLLGRINDWKGQDILIQALAQLSPDQRKNVKVRIVGSTFDNHTKLEVSLRRLIAANKLEDVVVLEQFQDDTKPLFEWCDVVVVPSKKPEPFGRTAIEGMSYMRPVLCSAHGGLIEIVQHHVTGWLVPPNDPSALSNVIGDIVAGQFDLPTLGENARKRYLENFTSEKIERELADFFRSCVAR